MSDFVTLSLGSQGEDVKVWQIIVGAKPDGDFGPLTKKLTIHWQLFEDLLADGIVGDVTWTKALADPERLDKVKKESIAIGIAGGLLAGIALKAIFGSKNDAPGLAQSLPLINRLHPELRSRAEELLARAWAEGVNLVVTQGLRTNDEQARLYAQGRTTPGPIVTNAPPGSSWHNFGMAFDVAVLSPEGKATWPNNEALWQKIGAIGKSTGLKWGGDWTTIKDRPHFEYHPGLTLADARAGKTMAIA